MSRDRKRAIALRAADAPLTINARFSQANLNMTPRQLDQVQRVFDAAVVNPAVQREYQDMYKRSVIAQSGAVVNRDERIVRKAEKIAEELIAVSERDRRVRLRFELLITPDALVPRTDNPDEAAYLKTVLATLENQGVWLRVGQPYVRQPGESGWVLDPRKYDVWLSLGPDGDPIPSKDGSLTRDVLLGTTRLGAGYYSAVHDGPVQRALNKEIRRLSARIDDGIEEHNRLIKRKADAAFGVAEISDAFGRADLPSRSIWDFPQRLVMKALEAKVGGNVNLSQPYLVVAAIVTRNNARMLATYADKSSAGAGFVVTILEVAKTAGQVAEVGLALTGVGGLLRGGTSVATGAAASSVDAAAERMLARYVAKNPEIASELGSIRWVQGPKGTVLGGVKGGHSSGAGTGMHTGW